ncbi:hypothetical protein BT96DRAFT_1021503 [Gymnopus androsaceus JB14]|uniref:Uncharacterized protein n=1 Tax=Gymnopus androsaceus JB14 TaxID=1447944 RepID=A0A6A4HEJ4_9AGAR|nr:hypothetical protein BT96DRAFT_1021503 [Gymnopus androsaceus JB14]
MAALYLHNAIFIPEPSERREHTRTISSTTLRTITTDQSHPTEPLLHSTNSGSLAYQDLLSRQPEYSSRNDDELILDDLPPSSREKQGFGVLGLWALYNTIRYFIAYTIYESLQGQIAALALGTSTAVCFVLFICAAILSALQSYLLRAHIPIHSLLVIRTVLRYLGSFFLLSPAIAFAIFRVVFTLLIIALFLYIASAYNGTRRPSQSSQRRRKRRRRRMESVQSLTMSPPPTSASSQLPLAPGHPTRHPSGSTVASQGNRLTSDRSLRNSQASADFDPSSSDDDDESSDPPHFDPVLMQQRLNNAIPLPIPQSDRELNNFADRFRALVSQISLETDNAVRTAQSGADNDNAEPSLLPEDIYTTLSSQSYSHEDYAYPPDDQIHILNGIRPANANYRESRQSRPPTRSVTEFTGSEPPSRANSLSLTAAIGGHGLTAQEMGELMEKVERRRRRVVVL